MTGSGRQISFDGRGNDSHGCDSIQESRPQSYQTFWSLAAPQVPSAIRGSKSGRSGHETIAVHEVLQCSHMVSNPIWVRHHGKVSRPLSVAVTNNTLWSASVSKDEVTSLSRLKRYVVVYHLL